MGQRPSLLKARSLSLAPSLIFVVLAAVIITCEFCGCDDTVFKKLSGRKRNQTLYGSLKKNTSQVSEHSREKVTKIND